MNYCPNCGERMETRSSRGGLPRRVCPSCDDESNGYGGNSKRLVTDGGQPPKTGPARALWDMSDDEVREIFDDDTEGRHDE